MPACRRGGASATPAPSPSPATRGIGRGAGRERGENSGGGGLLKKKKKAPDHIRSAADREDVDIAESAAPISRASGDHTLCPFTIRRRRSELAAHVRDAEGMASLST